MGYLRDLYSPLRLDHAHKNGFVVLGSIAALKADGVAVDASVLRGMALGFAAACLMSSANYAINEILDAPSDRFHPTKKFRPLAAERVPVWQVGLLGLLFAALSLLVAASVSVGLVWGDVALFLSGLIYNVPPIRAKDVPFLDVVVESFNNPVRLAMGWFAVPGVRSYPPASLAITFWAIGALLMTAKRFAEIRDLDSADLLRYRKSFEGYTDESLHIAMVVHACLFAFSFGVVTQKYAPDVMLMIPFVLVFIAWYFHLSYQPKSIVKEPERLIGHVAFLSYCIAVFVLLLVLLFGPPAVRETSRWLASRF